MRRAWRARRDPTGALGQHGAGGTRMSAARTPDCASGVRRARRAVSLVGAPVLPRLEAESVGQEVCRLNKIVRLVAVHDGHEQRADHADEEVDAEQEAEQGVLRRDGVPVGCCGLGAGIWGRGPRSGGASCSTPAHRGVGRRAGWPPVRPCHRCVRQGLSEACPTLSLSPRHGKLPGLRSCRRRLSPALLPPSRCRPGRHGSAPRLCGRMSRLPNARWHCPGPIRLRKRTR